MLRKLADLIVFPNLFVAFAVACLTLETSLLTTGNPDLKYPSFVFFATLFLYNFHRVYKMRANTVVGLQDRHRWVISNRMLFYSVFVLSAVGLAITTFAFLSFETILLLLPVAVVSFGYSLPVFRWKNKRSRLRDIPGLKIILISFVLAWVTLLIPFFYYDLVSMSERDFYYFSYAQLGLGMLVRMLFIFAITVPFDIRDMDYDREQNVRTIPVVLGVRKSKAIALMALVVHIILVLLLVDLYGGYWKTGLALIASAVVAAIAIILTQKKRSEYFFTFLVEGTMVVQALLVWTVYYFRL